MYGGEGEPAGVEAFAEGVAPGSGDVGHRDGDRSVGVDGWWRGARSGWPQRSVKMRPSMSVGVPGDVEQALVVHAVVFGAQPDQVVGGGRSAVFPVHDVMDLDAAAARRAPCSPGLGARWPWRRATGTMWRRRPMSRGRPLRTPTMTPVVSHRMSRRKASGRAGPSWRWAPPTSTWITAR